jgi:uncharacterized iron-regulated membrane protein
VAASEAGERGKGKRRRRGNWMRVALLLHNWLGLKMALVLSVVLLSGTLAVFRYEIDGLIYPQMRVTAGTELASLDQIVAAVTAAYPGMGIGDDIPTGIGSDGTGVGIVGVSPERGIRLIWVDPYTATVQGDTPLFTPGFFFANLHRELFIPEWGIVIVCSFAISLTISLVTGLLLYRRFWLGFLRRPRTRSARIFAIDLHRLIGLWSLWFAVVMAVTSLWYFWTLVGESKLGFPAAVEQHGLPALPEERLAQLGPAAPEPLALQTALQRATARYPDFVSTYVTLPARHGEALVFHGSRGEILADNATAIAVDPFSGEILGANLLSDRPAGNHIGAMVTPLHYGNFGGLAVKALWFVFGLGLSSVAITGVVFYWSRSARTARSALSHLLRAFHPRRGAMGWFKPLNWVVLAGAVFCTVLTAQFFFHRLADAPAHYAPQTVGPWPLGATLLAGFGDTSDPRRPGATGLAVVHYCADCWDDIRRLWVHIGAQAPAEDARGTPVSGRPGFAFAPVQLPETLDRDQRLWLVAEGWDRRRVQASWPLGEAQ